MSHITQDGRNTILKVPVLTHILINTYFCRTVYSLLMLHVFLCGTLAHCVNHLQQYKYNFKTQYYRRFPKGHCPILCLFSKLQRIIPEWDVFRASGQRRTNLWSDFSKISCSACSFNVDPQEGRVNGWFSKRRTILAYASNYQYRRKSNF